MKDKKFFVFVVSAVLFNLLLNSVFLRNPRTVLIVFLIQLTFIVFIHFLSRRQSEGRQFGVETINCYCVVFPKFHGNARSIPDGRYGFGICKSLDNYLDLWWFAYEKWGDSLSFEKIIVTMLGCRNIQSYFEKMWCESTGGIL